VRRWKTVSLTGPVDVIDGDSLRVDGVELRLEGIDAPEYRQTCRRGDRAEPCGRQARDALVALVGHARPICAVASHDRFGRGLARCRVGDLDVNRAMVERGQAVAFGDYEAEEAAARAAGRGIWATRFERPADWRAGHPREP
jgi:endonuclease YncB( thermonuclease family)